MALRASLTLFIVNFFAIAVLQYAVLSYVVGVVRTLEKRFGLSSTQMGILFRVGDLGIRAQKLQITRQRNHVKFLTSFVENDDIETELVSYS